MADNIRENGGDADMRVEFWAFCKLLLSLLKEGKTARAIADLEEIVKKLDK